VLITFLLNLLYLIFFILRLFFGLINQRFINFSIKIDIKKGYILFKLFYTPHKLFMISYLYSHFNLRSLFNLNYLLKNHNFKMKIFINLS